MSFWDGEGYSNNAPERLTEEAFFKAMKAIHDQKPKPSGPPEQCIYFSEVGNERDPWTLMPYMRIKTMNDPESS